MTPIEDLKALMDEQLRDRVIETVMKYRKRRLPWWGKVMAAIGGDRDVEHVWERPENPGLMKAFDYDKFDPLFDWNVTMLVAAEAKLPKQVLGDCIMDSKYAYEAQRAICLAALASLPQESSSSAT